MELSILILISILIILVVVLIILVLFKKSKKQDNTEILEKQQLLSEGINLLKENFYNNNLSQSNNLFNFQKQISENLEKLNSNINNQISENFKENSKTSKELMENIGKLSEKSDHIKQYNVSIQKLIDILNNNKLRGRLGEFELEKILSSIFGDNTLFFERQKQLSNSKIVDILLHAPKPIGDICIDSKFPLNNFRNLLENQDDINKENEYKKAFESDVEKHIKDIKTKYIIKNETSEYAIMFIPAEYIYIYINNFMPDLVEKAYKSNIWLASPTTLISTLSMVSTILMNIKRDKESKKIREHLLKLDQEFIKFIKRSEVIFNTFNKLNDGIKDFNITAEKINKKFNDIKNLKENDEKNNDLEKEGE